MFTKIQTYLLKRIFEEVDPSLFQVLKDPVSPFATTSTTLPTPSLSIVGQFLNYETNNNKFTPHGQPETTLQGIFKTQIRIYNQIINQINLYKNQLTDGNYRLVVLYFEYYYLYIKTSKVVEPNLRRQLLSHINYILTSIDTASPPMAQDCINSFLKVLVTLHPITSTNNNNYKGQQVNEIISDLNYFISQSQSPLTKTTLLHAVSLTFAYEVFHYPILANKISQSKSLTLKQRRLLTQFSRFYFLTSWKHYTQSKSLTSVSLDEVGTSFCQSEFDKVVEDVKEERKNEEGKQEGDTTDLGTHAKRDGCNDTDHGCGGVDSTVGVDDGIDNRVIQLYNAGSLAELRSDEIIQSFQEAMKEYRMRRQLN
ncbi:hypothetical protein KGF57_000455 [Candida theae]|uniref:Uncharacterized protein n=1 Tax=Candida theae TaxID=1198502 RepID=A0AAD5G0U1_9ASCO|nr:uncharacterized protein KGF57_000455 [Candida theae]KAI5967240.1 hypothetical protein KGF57_000455 [Candida theae]